jgi:hypothetical protein
MHVNTRNGIFGAGGYGGGVFDGSMAVSGVGSVRTAGLGATQIWWAARYGELQEYLNAELAKIGCSGRLTVDNLIADSQSRSRTCWALGYVIDYAYATGMQVDPAFVAFVEENRDFFQTQCGLFTPYAISCPPIPEPAPTPPEEPIPTEPIPTGPSVQDVLGVQQILNPALCVMGMQPIPESGAVNATLCGAIDAANLQWIALATRVRVEGLVLADAVRQPLEDWYNLIDAYGPLMTAWCQAVPRPWPAPGVGTGWCAPQVAPAPGPPAPAPAPPTLTAEHVMNLQRAVNPIIWLLGFETIPETGTLDARTCGAVRTANFGVSAIPYTAETQSHIDLWLTAMDYAGLVVQDACAAFAEPLPMPARRPDAEPVVTDVCTFNFGDESDVIVDLQLELNVALETAGYEPIPTTGVYDGRTCGAIFALMGTFQPTVTSAECPNGWLVPFECAESIQPTRKEEKKKMSTAAMFGIAALVAAVVVGGVYAARKAKVGA